DEDFLADKGLDPQGNLYKATLDGACLSIFDDVEIHWEKKTNENESRDDLQELIDNLDSVSDADLPNYFQQNFDYDRLMNILALNSLLANGSTYYHNYYMYHDIAGSGNWIMLPWDVDKTFAQYGASYPYHRTSYFTYHDNPLPERVFIVPELFDAYRGRVLELATTLFTTDHLFPLIDSLMVVIEASVENDHSDNVYDLNDWQYRTSQEKVIGIEGRIPDLIEQLSWKPRSFELERTPYSFPDSVTLRWGSSSDPNGDPVRYKLAISRSLTFAEDLTTWYTGLQDTVFTPPDTFNPYVLWYWMVQAIDGMPGHEVEGFDTYNSFKVVEGTVLPPSISEDMTLNILGSPYYVNEDLTVESGVLLEIEYGSEIRLADGVRVLVKGQIDAHGYAWRPIHFMPRLSADRWGALCFEAGSAPSTLEHVLIEGASSGVAQGGPAWQKAAISSYATDLFLQNLVFRDNYQCVYANEASVELRDSQFLSGNQGEHFNLRVGTALIEDCVFENVTAGGDAVDFDGVSDGQVRRCQFSSGEDDFIDVGEGSFATLEGNSLSQAADKGVSVGERSTATLLYNTIEACDIAVAVKDSSFVTMDRNTLYGNVLGISAYEKNAGQGGGFATVINGIVSSSLDSSIAIDPLSAVQFRYSLSDTDSIPGIGNLFEAPLFVDASAGNFNLTAFSPCINAGDPLSPPDPDGTLADMGALPFDMTASGIVINEINYHSSGQFNPEDWVELHNPGDQAIDISGMQFMDLANTFVIPEGTVIAAHAYLVLCRSYQLFHACFPEVTQVVGDLGFGFSGGGEALSFRSAEGVIYDQLVYDDAPPWPPEADGFGPTLELLDAEFDNSLPESWASSQGYGTPGALNSVSDAVGVSEGTPGASTVLRNVFPNPFNPTTEIRFSLLEACDIRLSVHDLSGRLLALLADGPYVAGNHSLQWQGRDERGMKLASGVYFLRLSDGESSHSRKLLLLK
ncbi:MAG: CotH kinase family protein, partial [Candidatus Krumholzibacteria bacterium]|nr:CotH kinase family protein [Candidatus Krumholzibacteria bacterium]